MRYYYAIVVDIDGKQFCTATLDTFEEKVDENHIPVTPELYQDVLGKEWTGSGWVEVLQ